MIAALRIQEKDSRVAIMAKYIGWILLAWVPAQLIGGLVRDWLPGNPSVQSFNSPVKTFSALVLGPILETWLLGLTLKGLAWLPFRTSSLSRSIMAGIIWTIPHIRTSSSWGTHATWSFFIFAFCYEKLREKSWEDAMVGTTIIHSGFNLVCWYVYLYFEWKPEGF
jgi:hypothetical protein